MNRNPQTIGANRRRVWAFAALLVWLAAAPAAADEQGETAAVLNPNVAGEEEMAALPGVSPELAAQIVAQRPFSGMAAFDELVRASVDEAGRTHIYERLFVPIDLNTASREEILLVPGVGEKLAHEFEEYRPYRAMAQFRREIGKYVSDEEVARFEPYVTLE